MKRWMRTCVVVLLLVLPIYAFGQSSTVPQDQPTNVLAQYAQATQTWVNVAQGYATDLFLILASIDICWLGVTLILEGHDMQHWVAKLIKKLAAIGFFWVLLEKAGSWVPLIISSFSFIGTQAGGLPTAGLRPSEVMFQGLQICGLIFQGFNNNILSFLSFTSATVVFALIITFCCICIFLAYLIITITFVMAKIEAYIVLSAGFIFLGFGGSKWTSNYVERYLALAAATGVRLMVLYMLIGLGGALGQLWMNMAQNAQINLNGAEAVLGIVAGAFTFMAVCWSAPKMISGMLSGSISTGAGELLAPAAALGVGAATVAAAAATGGAALAGAGAAGGATGAEGTLSGAGSMLSTGATAAGSTSSPIGPMVEPPGFGGGGVGGPGFGSSGAGGSAGGGGLPLMPAGGGLSGTGGAGESAAAPSVEPPYMPVPTMGGKGSAAPSGASTTVRGGDTVGASGAQNGAGDVSGNAAEMKNTAATPANYAAGPSVAVDIPAAASHGAAAQDGREISSAAVLDDGAQTAPVLGGVSSTDSGAQAVPGANDDANVSQGSLPDADSSGTLAPAGDSADAGNQVSAPVGAPGATPPATASSTDSAIQEAAEDGGNGPQSVLQSLADTATAAREEVQTLSSHLPQHDAAASAPQLNINHGE